MKTAAAFTKGLLELEGQLTPILVSLVTVEEKNRQMLDISGNCEIKAEMDRCKRQLDVLQVGRLPKFFSACLNSQTDMRFLLI